MNMSEMKEAIDQIAKLEKDLDKAYLEITPYIMEIENKFLEAKVNKDDVTRMIGSNTYQKIVRREYTKRRDKNKGGIGYTDSILDYKHMN